MPDISFLASTALRHAVAEFGSETLQKMLWLATGQWEWRRRDIAAFAAPSLERRGRKWRPVVVNTAALHQALATQSTRYIDPDNHNYRRRYGTYGDRETYEGLLAANLAWRLPSLMLRRSGYIGRHFLTVDEQKDAGSVAATLRDNGWHCTTVLCPQQDVGYFRNAMRSKPPVFPQLKGEFKLCFGEVMVAALDALPQGTIIGEAVKHSPELSIGGIRTHKSAWLYQGHIVSSAELLEGDLVPVPALITQVHHALVSAMAGPGGNRLHQVPKSVWKPYQSYGRFAWYC